MKNILLVVSGLIFGSINAQVGIGTSTPNPSSILDINVNSLPTNAKKGLLLPQVALTSVNDLTTIPNPANGLLVYNTVNAGLVPTNVVKDNVYKFLTSKNAWVLMLDQDALANLSIPTVASVLGFNKTGNDTTYLGADISGGNQIRQVMYDRIRLQSAVCTYDSNTKEFIANKAGYFNFQVNLVVKGPINGNVRIGVSKPYTGPKPTSVSNATVAFLSQNTYDAAASLPIPMAVNGLLYMNAGEKVIFMTRYIDPSVNSLDVESINYDRTLVSSVNVTYFSN
ncbi:hypothetical protein A0O34_20250 [Chryseobacterium glaciei]|uniref:Uncharacterized protein n=1 Tax=Chryseobacterium glaciei TaxID=1685010 RepID=A0A172Y0H7_9FLAO|nr:hypothetical protein [Chryseobacterium glaciei]ANF52701.1 hypothetical protein A0O34_20250 [Chryseobacterium glaciei]